MKTSLTAFLKKWDVVIILIALKLVIHLIPYTNPKRDLKPVWKELVETTKKPYGF